MNIYIIGKNQLTFDICNNLCKKNRNIKIFLISKNIYKLKNNLFHNNLYLLNVKKYEYLYIYKHIKPKSVVINNIFSDTNIPQKKLLNYCQNINKISKEKSVKKIINLIPFFENKKEENEFIRNILQADSSTFNLVNIEKISIRFSYILNKENKIIKNIKKQINKKSKIIKINKKLANSIIYPITVNSFISFLEKVIKDNKFNNTKINIRSKEKETLKNLIEKNTNIKIKYSGTINNFFRKNFNFLNLLKYQPETNNTDYIIESNNNEFFKNIFLKKINNKNFLNNLRKIR